MNYNAIFSKLTATALLVLAASETVLADNLEPYFTQTFDDTSQHKESRSR